MKSVRQISTYLLKAIKVMGISQRIEGKQRLCVRWGWIFLYFISGAQYQHMTDTQGCDHRTGEKALVFIV